jgi:predicted permease
VGLGHHTSAAGAGLLERLADVTDTAAVPRWLSARASTVEPVTAALQLVPVFAGVAAGHLLVRTGVATREHGRFLFVFAFYVCVPALVFDAFFDAELSWEMAALPLAALLAIVGGYVAGLLVSRTMRLSPPRLAVFLMACMIVNSGFTLPFIQARLGEAGVARLMAFDVVNATLVFTWVYAIAIRSNPDQRHGSVVWSKLFASPPLYWLAAGLVANVADLRPSDTLLRLVDAFGAPTSFLAGAAGPPRVSRNQDPRSFLVTIGICSSSNAPRCASACGPSPRACAPAC